jgi:hypothetical protein
MKQSVATARLLYQTLEKLAQIVENLGFKASPSSQLINGTTSKKLRRNESVATARLSLSSTMAKKFS